MLPVESQPHGGIGVIDRNGTLMVQVVRPIPTVYLAGPISGLLAEDAENWRDAASDWLWAHNIMVFSPMRHKEYLRGRGILNGTYEEPLATLAGIVARDLKHDVPKCDAILANLLGATEVSIGTIIEIALGYYIGKPIIIVIEPGRWSGLGPERSNPMDHDILTMGLGAICVLTLESALETVSGILLP